MGRAAREFAVSLSWQAVLEDMVEFHSRLAGARPDAGFGVGPGVATTA
jgi:hypothetical protein